MKLRSPLPELDGATIWINGKVRKEELLGEKLTLIHFWSVSCYLSSLGENTPTSTKRSKWEMNRLNYIY